MVWDYGDSAQSWAGLCMQLVLEGGPLYLDAEKTKPAVLDSLLYDFEYLTVKEMFEIKFDANGAEVKDPLRRPMFPAQKSRTATECGLQRTLP